MTLFDLVEAYNTLEEEIFEKMHPNQFSRGWTIRTVRRLQYESIDAIARLELRLQQLRLKL